MTPSQKAFGLALLVGIVAYFWSIWSPRPQVGGGEAALSGAGLEVPPQAAVLEVPPLEGLGDCQGYITAIGRSGDEVAFQYEGVAGEVILTWPGGEYRARTADVCTGTACRLTLPRPGMPGVQIALDSCPPEPVP